MNKSRMLLLIAMVVGAVLLRLIPHPMNFTPVGAIAIFAGAMFPSKRLAFGVPLVIMFLSDCLLGFHMLMPATYLCFVISVYLGHRFVGSDASAMRIVSTSLLGSLCFFVVTNFACWLVFYSPTLPDFVRCYQLAIPFFRNTVASDLIYCGVFFGAFALAQWRFPAMRDQTLSANV